MGATYEAEDLIKKDELNVLMLITLSSHPLVG